jgi:hypothetical protein
MAHGYRRLDAHLDSRGITNSSALTNTGGPFSCASSLDFHTEYNVYDIYDIYIYNHFLCCLHTTVTAEQWD